MIFHGTVLCVHRLWINPKKMSLIRLPDHTDESRGWAVPAWLGGRQVPDGDKAGSQHYISTNYTV